MPVAKTKIINHKAIIKLLNSLSNASFDFIRVNNLYLFDDKLGFSLIQGE